jgi:hypothetical protein
MIIDTNKSPNLTLNDLIAITKHKGYVIKKVLVNGVVVGYDN